MNTTDNVENCISRILRINNAKYCIGLFQDQGLSISKEWISCISKAKDETFQRTDFNLNTKKVTVSKRDKNGSGYIPVSLPTMGSVTAIDVSNSGLRWEGPCLNNLPFGYGSMYNSSNELIYRGVMIGDKKECFGIDYYPGLNKTKYCGCYWNNERHGFGMLYDRKGELLYEGDWLYDLNDNTMNQKVVLKDLANDRIVHSLIRELVIGEGCGKDYKGDLVLNGLGFPNLTSITTESYSFYHKTRLRLESTLIND